MSDEYGYDEYELPPPCPLPLHKGVEYPIEDETEKLLARDRRSMREADPRFKPEYQTPDQLALCHSREVIGPYGVPDRHRAGIYRRAYNPELGKRPTRLAGGDDG